MKRCVFDQSEFERKVVMLRTIYVCQTEIPVSVTEQVAIVKSQLTEATFQEAKTTKITEGA